MNTGKTKNTIPRTLYGMTRDHRLTRQRPGDLVPQLRLTRQRPGDLVPQLRLTRQRPGNLVPQLRLTRFSYTSYKTYKSYKVREKPSSVRRQASAAKLVLHSEPTEP